MNLLGFMGQLQHYAVASVARLQVYMDRCAPIDPVTGRYRLHHTRVELIRTRFIRHRCLVPWVRMVPLTLYVGFIPT